MCVRACARARARELVKGYHGFIGEKDARQGREGCCRPGCNRVMIVWNISITHKSARPPPRAEPLHRFVNFDSWTSL